MLLFFLEGQIKQKKKGGRYEVAAAGAMDVCPPNDESQTAFPQQLTATCPPIAPVTAGSSKSLSTAFYAEVEDTAASTAYDDEIVNSCDVVQETGSATLAQRYRQPMLQVQPVTPRPTPAAVLPAKKRKEMNEVHSHLQCKQ